MSCPGRVMPSGLLLREIPQTPQLFRAVAGHGVVPPCRWLLPSERVCWHVLCSSLGRATRRLAPQEAAAMSEFTYTLVAFASIVGALIALAVVVVAGVLLHESSPSIGPDAETHTDSDVAYPTAARSTRCRYGERGASDIDGGRVRTRKTSQTGWLVHRKTGRAVRKASLAPRLVPGSLRAPHTAEGPHHVPAGHGNCSSDNWRSR